MSRKAMTKDEFNKLMKKCHDNPKVRYVSPVIHPRAKEVVSFTIWSTLEEVTFSITNNPDENFNLFASVNEYLDSL